MSEHPLTYAAISFLVFILGWHVFSMTTSDLVAPDWGRILGSLGGLDYSHILITTLRILGALAISFLIAILGALALSNSIVVERLIIPLIRAAMAVPAVCWVLFSVLWFAAVEYRIAFVLVMVCFPVFLVDMLDAIKNVPRALRDMTNAFRPTRLEYYRKLIIPAITPSIFTSWKINTSLALRVVTIAELVGAISGVGYALNVAAQTFSIADVFAWTAVLTIMLLWVQVVITRIEGKVLHWRD